MRMRWMGDQCTDRLRAKLFGNVDAAGERLRDEITEVISTPGPPRSAPGQPPHIDTDRLHTSWSHETDEIDDIIVTRVSTDTPYAVDLEYGTSNMAARPFIVPTVISTSDELARTICKP